MPFDYGSLIGAGLGIGSAVLQGQQANNANQLSQQNAQRLFDLAAQEQARKDSLTRAFLPSVMFGMGSHNPVGSAQRAYPTTLPTSGSGQFQTPNPYQQQQSSGPGIGSALLSAGATAAPLIAKGLGAGASAAGTAAGTGTAAGGGFGSTMAGLMTNPFTIGGAAAAAGGAAWLKSQAHWEANDIVKNLQNPYHQNVLTPLSKAVETHQITPQQGLSELNRTWGEYMQQLEKFAPGFQRAAQSGKMNDRQRVAIQSMAKLQPLIQQMQQSMQGMGGQA